MLYPHMDYYLTIRMMLGNMLNKSVTKTRYFKKISFYFQLLERQRNRDQPPATHCFTSQMCATVWSWTRSKPRTWNSCRSPSWEADTWAFELWHAFSQQASAGSSCGLEPGCRYAKQESQQVAYPACQQHLPQTSLVSDSVLVKYP